MSLRSTDFIGNAGQTNFFMEHNTTESSENIYCLFNGEYGMHSAQEMSITKKQVQTALLTQHNAYKNYIGKTYGSFVCEAIEYNNRKRYTVRGFYGTLSEIYSHFKPNISEQTIRQRLKKGMDIETAMFMPAQAQGRPRK